MEDKLPAKSYWRTGKNIPAYYEINPMDLFCLGQNSIIIIIDTGQRLVMPNPV